MFNPAYAELLTVANQLEESARKYRAIAMLTMSERETHWQFSEADLLLDAAQLRINRVRPIKFEQRPKD